MSLMIADCTNRGAMRGYAQFDAETASPPRPARRLPSLLGEGHLAFTVDQGRPPSAIRASSSFAAGR